MLCAVLRRPAGWIPVVVLLAVAALALAGPALAPWSPYDSGFPVLTAPNGTNLLGTDYLGRDVLSRLLHGARLSVLGAVEAVLVGLVLGVLPGVLSVFLGRGFEWASLRVVDTLIALPSLIFAVAVTALIGNGLGEAMLVVGVMISPFFYRLARAAALGHAAQGYVQAAGLMGASPGWILWHHIAPRILPVITIGIATVTGHSLIVVSSLTFLGIGVQPPEPTWGGMLASDLQYLSQRPWAPVFPGLLIVCTVAALNLLADTLRDAERRDDT